MAEDTRAVETTEDFGKGEAAKVSRYLAEIKAYDTHFKPWDERCKKIVKRYRDEQETDTTQRRFNILWSNVQTLGPALYGRKPIPDVSRRFKDRDPIGRAASTILERCLGYSVDAYDFDSVAKSTRDDYLLTARGTAWVRYVPHFGDETKDKIFLQTVEDDAGTTYQDEGGNVVESPEMEGDRAYTMGEPYTPVAYEEAVCDHIPWEDFGHTPAPKWEKVTAVWKCERMTRKQLVERFGEKLGKEVQLTERATGIAKAESERHGDVFMRAKVYEIWDRTDKKVIWISPGYRESCLDEQDDPLHLNGFFPCPKPLYGTMTTDSLVPVPDYVEYQAQALELDTLTQRISLLIDAIRVVGIYNGEIADLQNMLQGQENRMIAVNDGAWAMFAEKGGLKGQVDFFPVQEVATVLQILAESRERIKQDLFEISGISDIVRGQVDPREKLGQSQMKGQFATLRLQDRQSEMNRIVRDLLRLKGEIIAEHFSPESLMEMSGWRETMEAKVLDRARDKAVAEMEQMRQQLMEAQQTGQQPQMPMAMPEIPPSSGEVFEQAVQLLRDDRLRTFRVDIESDSTAFEDQQAEKQGRTELLTAIGGYLQQSAVIVQSAPEMKPLLGHLLLFGIRAFKPGRHVEAMFEEALEDMEMAPPPQQEGDPAMMAAAKVEQAKTQIEGQKLQLTAQKDQATLALDQEKFQHTSRLEEMKFQAEEAARARL
ncbi:MAG TPA: hypothetical protein VGA17_11540, partial [Nitrospiraceae bacterium]